VPQSNIIDSISELTRARKNFAPPGTDALCQALAQMNVPLELVGNPTRRLLIQKHKSQRGGGVVEIVPEVHINKSIQKKKQRLVSIKNARLRKK